MTMLPDEILLLIAKTASRAQLATLCQVSHKLHEICIPLLYNEARLQNADWKLCLRFLDSVASHPGIVRSLHVGRDIYLEAPWPLAVRDDMLTALKKCLKQIHEKLEVAHFSSNEPMCELFSRPRGWEVLSYLADCPNLVEVSLVNNDGLPYAFEGCIPAFRGLRRLELLRLSHDNHDRDQEIADILVSCPDLFDLSLSMAGWPTGFDNGLLLKLIQRFCNKTKRRLRLQSLRLGYGFLPIESSTDYLQQLTDLTALDRLRLDNDNVGVPTVLIDAAIDVKLFASAGNVTSFTAERLSSDVADLINLLNTAGQLVNLSLPRFCETQPRARMDEDNEFWDPERYDEEVEDLPQWGPGQLFSQPLKTVESQWRKVLIGDIFHTSKMTMEVLNCAATYEQLEDLTLPLPKAMWPEFRDEVLPQLRSLQRLFLVGGDNAGGHGYQGLTPDLCETMAFESSENVPDRLEKYRELVQRHNMELLSHTTKFVQDLFRSNRESIVQDDKRAPLKYLGLGGEVFTCMLLPPSATHGLAPFTIENAGQRWEYHVVKLTSDEAVAFDTIQEWHEGMITVRAGGDDGPDW